VRPMQQQDLGALFARITRRLIEAEGPLLEAHGLSMWGYIALSQLVTQPAATQLALAQAMRYDKTRLIGLLDQLEQDGLITRTPDPTDRRARIITLTDAGEARRAGAQADIRAMEDDLLAGLSAARRTQLREILAEVDLASSRSPLV
jgi:DNA-binding MarR family transcriptional regulator